MEIKNHNVLGRGVTATLRMDSEDEDSGLTFYIPKATAEVISDDIVTLVRENRIKLMITLVSDTVKNGFNIRSFSFSPYK